MSRNTATASNRSDLNIPACLLRLRAIVNSLPDHHARVAHFAMSNPAEFLGLEAREIGYQCSTSDATVVRFCQRMGYRGLSEMKNVLARELAQNLVAVRGVTKPGHNNSLAGRVFSDCMEALQDTLSGMDRRKIDSIAGTIARSEQIYLFGIGGSAYIAQIAALNFLAFGFQTTAFIDPIQQHAVAKLVTRKDVVIAVASLGSRSELAETLQTARKRKAFCVALTSFQQSLVAKNADDLLLMFIPPENLRGQAGAHRVAQIAVLDALAVCAAEIKMRMAKVKGRVRSEKPKLLIGKSH